MPRLRLPLPVTVACLAAWLIPPAAFADVDYHRDIKPLLAAKCAACHGVLKQEAGLRLDASQLIRQGGDSGTVIDVGNPEASLLLERVSATDESERMPPAGEGEPLKPDQLALLREWIAAGAHAPEMEDAADDPKQHWAFQSPTRPDVAGPESANPIDRLIEAKRRERGLEPVPAADPATLLRRVHFDLLGLPPTREELQSFLADPSEAAYRRVVDDLLARPEYGERWGRHWMDVWRYSDWDGFGAELRGSQKHIWRWRDWIIESLNADRPYDELVREMLAGDELAPLDPEVLRATGFLARNYYKFNRQMWLDNVVEHTTKAFLGLTINCAKCHDHKYDPLAMREYYQLQAVFEPYNVRLDRLPGAADLEQNGLSRIFDAEPAAPTYLLIRGDERQPDKSAVIEPALPAVFDAAFAPTPVELPARASRPFLDGPEQEHLRSQAVAAVSAARGAVDDAIAREAAAVGQLRALERSTDPNRPSATPVLNDEFADLNDAIWEPRNGEWEVIDGRLRQTRVAAETCQLIAREPVPDNFHASFRFRILRGQTYHSVGLSFDWLDEQNSNSVYLSAHGPGPKAQVSFIQHGQSTYPNDGLKALPIGQNREYALDVFVRGKLLNVHVDGELVLVYALPHERRAGRFAAWAFDSQAEFLSVSVSPLRDETPLAQSSEEIGRFAVTVEQARRNLAAARDAATLARHQRAVAEALLESFEARLAADRARAGVDASADINRLAERASRAERTHRILQAEASLAEARQKRDAARAELRPGDDADRTRVNEAETALSEATQKLYAARGRAIDGTFEPIAQAYPATSSGRRLALANWIANRDNPLTARVAANQIWMRHFGRPLVDNVFDFGLRTPRPRQAELLDWLAVELMDQNWRMKPLHRLIVTSETYRRASAPADEEQREVWERNRERDRENEDLWRADVRRLDAEAVRDAVLFAAGSLDLTRGGPDIDYSEGERLPRRSVYFRHAYEKQMLFLTTFDAASPNECYRRSESIIPHQALAMANSRLSLEQARLLAERLWTAVSPAAESDDPGVETAYVTSLFEATLTRPPTVTEVQVCREFLASQRELLSHPDALTSFVGGAAEGREPSADPAHRARENLAHVLLNHNDFATVR
ncbi:MAG: PSD1 domain-containing protein [Planctomyces sp.]|nr:PSD1 domain-containing protein [Planctomyces sp.]